MTQELPASWSRVLGGELDKPYFHELQSFVQRERAQHTVYPPPDDVFNAFVATPYERVKVLLLGQDPYHGDGQAHGMCFSVRPGVRIPPSLANAYKELKTDLGCSIPTHGSLQAWADRGVLLLNTVLTVRAGEPASHAGRGWETFTDAVIYALNDREAPVVFLLWGAHAQKKRKLITCAGHRVIATAHPSPLSARKFYGSKPFSAVNDALVELGKPPIDWQLLP